ncbi:MAG: hypothetical protein QNJ73_17070 [Gammaproteobacteria bacterium]|nr:hypothetical protein [Gammaproteobacteria bacterium]
MFGLVATSMAVAAVTAPGFAYVTETELAAISDYLKELHGNQ